SCQRAVIWAFATCALAMTANAQTITVVTPHDVSGSTDATFPVNQPITLSSIVSGLPRGGGTVNVDYSITGAGTFSQNDLTTTPYEFTFTPSVPGTYTIDADVDETGGTDAGANIASATSFTITVVGGTSLRASISSPNDRDSFALGESVTFSAVLSNAQQDANVNFYVNDVLLRNDSIFPFETTFIPTSVGEFLLHAEAVHSSGSVETTSEPVLISVIDPTLTASPDVPVLSFIYPLNGVSVPAGQAVTLSVDAIASNGGSLSVSFFQDGTLIASDTEAPFEVSWTPSTSGDVTITAIVSEEGVSGTSQSTLDVSVLGEGVPSISLVSSQSFGSLTLGNTLEVTAFLNGASGSSTVDFYIDGVLVSSTNSFPYTLSYIPNSTGDFIVYAVVQDQSGLSGISNINEFSVVPDGPPVVEVSLDEGVTFGVRDQILNINATASDVEGTIDRVDFFVDEVLVGSDDEAPFFAGYLPGSAGVIEIVAIATDDSGNTAQSSSLTVSIEQDDPAAIVDPVNNTEDFVQSIYSDFIFRQATTREIQAVLSEEEAGNTIAREQLVIDLIETREGESVFDSFKTYKGVWGYYPTSIEFEAALNGTIASSDSSNGDDHASDFFTSFPTPISSGETVDGIINFSGDLDIFEFVIDSDDSVTVLETFGNTDVAMQIWKIVGNTWFFVAQDDDSGADNNALLSLTLDTGVYRIHIDGSTNAVTGAYAVGVNADREEFAELGLDETLASELARGQISSEVYQRSFGDLNSTQGESLSETQRRDATARHYENFFDESATESQILQGSLRIAASDLSSFIASLSSGVFVSGQPYIWESPDNSLRTFTAYVIFGLWSIEPTDSHIDEVLSEAASDSKIDIVRYVLEHPNYLNRFRAFAIADREPLGASWYRSDWLGVYYEGSYPWVFSIDSEWFFTMSREESNLWLYQEELGWYWTNPDAYPYLYSDKESGWLYFGGRDGDFEWYYSFQSDSWFSVEN
ncbi:MAG: Ig-like domain-containing protein, partial [Verrucomicrobiota bacterium]